MRNKKPGSKLTELELIFIFCYPITARSEHNIHSGLQKSEVLCMNHHLSSVTQCRSAKLPARNLLFFHRRSSFLINLCLNLHHISVIQLLFFFIFFHRGYFYYFCTSSLSAAQHPSPSPISSPAWRRAENKQRKSITQGKIKLCVMDNNTCSISDVVLNKKQKHQKIFFFIYKKKRGR